MQISIHRHILPVSLTRQIEKGKNILLQTASRLYFFILIFHNGQPGIHTFLISFYEKENKTMDEPQETQLDADCVFTENGPDLETLLKEFFISLKEE